jgi:hypothetical protein
MEEAEISQDTLQADILATLQQTLDAFVESRAREGAALQAVILAGSMRWKPSWPASPRWCRNWSRNSSRRRPSA